MRRGACIGACLLLGLIVTAGFGARSASASTPTRTLSVSGAGVGMYPAFDPSTTRYAATTTTQTDGTLEVVATTADPDGTVLVDGYPTAGPTTVSGLAAGDEVSVIIDDAAGRAAYSVIYLPAGFPTLTSTVDEPGQQPGLIGLTLNAFNFSAPQPSYEAIVDRHGVPVFAAESDGRGLDLKQQPSGEITVSRPTALAGHTGTSLVVLDDQLAEQATLDVVSPLTNTDPHDSVRLSDGSTILLGYEPNSLTGRTDATVQKLDADGNETFRWSSAPYASETMTPSNPDYAHVNSVVSVENDDLIVSFRHLSAVYRIATVAHDGYTAGQVIWKLGGRDSDFTFVDDPYPSGPCAQHTVSELPDGHLLIFDNGTDLYCVNPLDPSGPGIFRGQTRVTEYALDTSVTPHTATLVWSYVPAGKYSWFAGSARRLANGDTLMAWAADRSVLATEIDANNHTIWEMTTPEAVPPLQRYATYRAALIPDVPDTIAPNVTPGLSDNSVYVVGDVVAPRFACADRGGSNLQTCTASGLEGGRRLDTGTPGARTWTITAEDGAGNATVVTRHYTVLAAFRPDGLLRREGRTWWKGGDLYGSAAGQTIHQRAQRGHTVTTYWRTQNDGRRADSFRLTATGSSPRMRVHYFRGRTDVTAAVLAGTYVTQVLSPGRATTLRIEVTPSRRSRVGAHRTFTLRSVSTHDATRTDAVAVEVRRR